MKKGTQQKMDFTAFLFFQSGRSEAEISSVILFDQS